jgi:16S rRNA (cytidine1402-2'-O)-methyltransferase
MKHTALMPGTLFVVATPIGNLDDITLRALRTLREVAVIAAEDTRRTAHLLARHGITTPTTSLHEHNETKKSGAIIKRLQGGEHVALVSDAGTPTVSDPGAALIRDATAAGIRVEPVPGPSAVIAALSVSGLSIESFTFLGFPPTRSKDRNSWFARLANIGGIAIFYEAPHRIHRTLNDLQAAIGDRPILVGRELTKVHEQLVKGPISAARSLLKSERGEFTVVVDIGHKTEIEPIVGVTTEKIPGSKREAIASLAKLLGVPANKVYEMAERLKNTGEIDQI